VFEVTLASPIHPLYTHYPIYPTILLKIWHLQSCQSQTRPQLGIECTKLFCSSHTFLSTLSTRYLTNLWCWLVHGNHFPIFLGTKKSLHLKTPIVIVDRLCQLGQRHIVCKTDHLSHFLNTQLKLSFFHFFTKTFELIGSWYHFVDNKPHLEKNLIHIFFLFIQRIHNAIYRLIFYCCTQND